MYREIDDDEIKSILGEIKEDILDFDWDFIENSNIFGHEPVHEFIKSEVVQKGLEKGYFAIPEVYANPKNGDKRKIDVVWFKNRNPVIAFEIDGSVKINSKEKLKSAEEYMDCKKVIISKARTNTNQERIDNLSDDYHHLDLRGLGRDDFK